MRRIPAAAYAAVALALAWAIFDVRGFGLVDDHILYADTYWAKHFYWPRNLGLGRFFPANGLEFSLLRKAGVTAPWVFRAVAAMKFALAAWLLFSALGRGGFRGWGRAALGLLVVLTPAMACASQRLFVSELNLFIGLLVVCRFWPEAERNPRSTRPLVQIGVTALCAALCFYKETVASMLLAAGGAGLATALWGEWRKRKMTAHATKAESDHVDADEEANAGADNGGVDAGDMDGAGRWKPADARPATEAVPVWFHLALMVVGAAYLAGYALFVLPHKVQSGYLALQAKDSPPWALARYVMNDPVLFAGLLAWGLGVFRRARRGLAFATDASLLAAALALAAQYVVLGLYSPYYLLPAYALAVSRLRPEDLGWSGADKAARKACETPSGLARKTLDTRTPLEKLGWTGGTSAADMDWASGLSPAVRARITGETEHGPNHGPNHGPDHEPVHWPALPQAGTKRPRRLVVRTFRAMLAGAGSVLLLGSLAAWAHQFAYLYYSQKNLSALQGFLTRMAAARTDRPVRLFTPQAAPDDEATLALGRLLAHLGLQADIDPRPDVLPGREARLTYPAGAAPDDAVLLTPLVRLADWETRRMEGGLPVLFATRSPLFAPDYSLEGFWLKWPGSHMSLAELDRRRATFRPNFVVLAPRGGEAFTPFDLTGLGLRILGAPEKAAPWSEAQLVVEVTNTTTRTWLAPPDDEDGGVVLAALHMRPDAAPRQIGRAALPKRLDPGERAKVRVGFRMPLGTDRKVIGAVAGRLTENGLALTPGGPAPYALVREDWRFPSAF